MKTKHRLYSTWKSVLNRCKNPNNYSYKYYGGRGIKVCKRWENFYLFLEDVGSSFKEGLTLDRINNDGGYSPDNFKWSSRKEQANNQSHTLSLEYEGRVFSEKELSRYTGVPRTTIQTRRGNGATVEQMVKGF